MKNKNVMVCVTQQKTCERLILKGHQLIKSEDDKLYVIHVVNEKEKFLQNVDDGEALEYLFEVSKKSGADLTVLRSKNIFKAMFDFAKKNNITHIVVGTPPENRDTNNLSVAFKLERELVDVEFLNL